MRNYLFILLFLFVGLYKCYNQEILLQKQVPDSLDETNNGPNKKVFRHVYVTFGMFLPFSNSIEIKPIGSFFYEFGFRNKYRLNNTFSECIDISVRQQYFSIKQSGVTVFSATDTFKTERIKINCLNGTFCQRINIGNRGNYMGYFIDVGISARWNYNNKFITIKEINNSNNGNKIKTAYNNPKYLERLGYGLVFRAGINRLVLEINYNLSDIIKHSYYSKDFVGLNLAIEYGIHR